MILTFFFFQGKNALAHGSQFFEFAPDYYHLKNVNLASSPTAYLFFQPQNDFLAGFDLWLDNSGSPGNISLSLSDDSGALVASKTVSVPTIATFAGGKQFHIDLNSQIPIQNTRIYSLKITSASPNINLYYANRIDVLEQNSPYVPKYLNGVTKLGSTEQNFSFKFALYETQDSAAPTITNVTSTILSSTAARINFNANEPIDFRIDLSETYQTATIGTNFLNTYKNCAEDIQTCELKFMVLPGKTYNYAILAKDEWRNQSAYTGTLETTAGEITVQGSSTSTESISPAQTSTSSPAQATSTETLGLPPEPAPPPASVKFSIGDRIKISDSVLFANVRSGGTLNATLLGTQNKGSQGAVTGGPLKADNYIWWEINYDKNPDGWTVEDYLVKISSTPPASPAPQAQTQTPAAANQTTQSSISFSGNDATITWSAPLAGEPIDGYAIDLYGETKNTVRLYKVKADVHELSLSNLPEDDYSFSIYALNGNEKTKISSGRASTLPKNPRGPSENASSGRGFWFYATIIATILIGLGIVIKVILFPTQ